MEQQKYAKKYRLPDAALFCLLTALFFAVTLLLFHRQTTTVTESYKSDMMAYIREMLGTETKYSFPYPVFFKVGAFFHLFTKSPAFAIALATAVLNVLALVISKLSLNTFCASEKKPLLSRVLVTATVFALFLSSMLYLRPMPKLGISWNYLGVFSPTPWHNATYLAARPFMILAFLWGAKLLDRYEQVRTLRDLRENGRDYALFSAFLLLATMTKPSYTIVHLGAAGLIMVWRFLRSKGQNLVPSLYLGLCYLPTFADLLYQYRGVFVPESGAEGGIGFGFLTVWSQYTRNLPCAILQAVCFPLVVLWFHKKELQTHTRLRFSWQIWLMGFAMAALLYEKGFRIYDFNFSWGYMCGIFLVFFTSGEMLIRDLLTGKDRRQRLFALAEALALAAHLCCGIRYFLTLLSGEIYY